jgi:hypothetical protein
MKNLKPLGSTLALPHRTAATLEQWNFPCFSSNDRVVARSLKKGLDYFGEEIDNVLLSFLISINDENGQSFRSRQTSILMYRTPLSIMLDHSSSSWD